MELLHTYLLGVEKYSWYYLHNEWTDPQSDLFATRLQSSSLDGLSLPALRASWMLQHPNNLIGKHLKALQQLTVFHLDDTLCDPLTFELVKATGELGALLWYHEIEDLKEYEVCVMLASSLLPSIGLTKPGACDRKTSLSSSGIYWTSGRALILNASS